MYRGNSVPRNTHGPLRIPTPNPLWQRGRQETQTLKGTQGMQLLRSGVSLVTTLTEKRLLWEDIILNPIKELPSHFENGRVCKACAAAVNRRESQLDHTRDTTRRTKLRLGPVPSRSPIFDCLIASPDYCNNLRSAWTWPSLRPLTVAPQCSFVALTMFSRCSLISDGHLLFVTALATMLKLVINTAVSQQ